MNWMWYRNVPEPQLAGTMTDIHGKTHAGTVPRELLNPEVWQKQLAVGADLLPSAFYELISKTKQPFVTKIHDVASSRATFFGGKLVLVGDALVAFRPHIALSSNQAALDCLTLEQVIEGEISMKQWERKVLNYGYRFRALSVMIGDYGSGKRLLFLKSLIRYVCEVVGQKLHIH